MVKKCLIEFIGTFFLVLVVAFTGNPIAIGVVLTALVYMGGYISGAHYNPAVTLAFLINKKITIGHAYIYMLVQFIGAICASVLYFIIHGSNFIPELGKNVPLQNAGIIEVLFTFLLVSVILHVAATNKTKNNDYYGVAIGFALMAGAFVGGPISGGVFNPAVGIGPLLFDISHIQTHLLNIGIYFSGPFIGGTLAGIAYKFLL